MEIRYRAETDSGDAAVVQICNDYWERKKRGWRHRLSTLADKHGVPKKDISRIARKNSILVSDQLACGRCGSLYVLAQSRENFKASKIGRYQNAEICAECAEEKGKEEKKRLYVEKMEQLKNAFIAGMYESLTPVEFNFLKALATTENITEAATVIGISKTYSLKLMEKFHGLNLVNYGQGLDGYVLFADLEDALQEFLYKKTVKPVFSSPPATRLYRILKRKYLFVYPEIPLCVFIEKHAIEHLLNEEWKERFFVSARVDFLVCNEDSTPMFGVEYHGGYHEQDKQQSKDAFKKRIFRAAGLSLRIFTYKNLQELESNGGIDHGSIRSD